jgi:hypothetical protein
LTVADVLQGYKEIPEEDRKKADVFFAQGAKVAGTGNYEYAIEMYLSGLAIDPDAKEAHQALREISMKRKASGGKDLGFIDKMQIKRPGKDDAENMLRAERLLSYDPGNTDNMLRLIKSAHKAGFYDTVLWMGPILQKANGDSGRNEDINKYLVLRDIYVDLKLWKQATDACQRAMNMRPDDMELQRIVKDLGAMDTMKTGNYLEMGSFRDSIKNMSAQRKLIEQDMDIRDMDVIARQIKEAEADYQADPNEAGKLSKLVDALVRSEMAEHEARAAELLQQWYEKTAQFRFRLALGKIRINQLRRQDRAELSRLRQGSKAAQESKDPKAIAEYNDLVEQYKRFQKNRNEQELKEFQLFSENYPTDMTYRYEWGVRLFALERYHDAIAMFQQARSDPKLRVDASTYLGRAFMSCGFGEEAVDTLKTVIDEYELRGDARSKELFYWYGNALELKGEAASALKSYSQLVQWDFNYRDVQARIKRLRAPQPGSAGG